MVADLYDVLGVGRDADPAAIRRAYRAAAKKSHPDSGGSREKFSLVTLAHDTLSDDERRKRYDETGEADGKQPDQREAQAMNIAIGAVNMALEEVQRRGLWHVDVIAEAVKAIENGCRERKSEVVRLTGRANLIEKMAGKFKARRGKVNRIGPMLLNQAREQRKNADAAHQQVELFTRAIQLLQDHEFETEPQQSRQPVSRVSS